MLGYQVDEVAAVLRVPPRTIKRYVTRVIYFGEVKANTIGRPINSALVDLYSYFTAVTKLVSFLSKIIDLRARRYNLTRAIH